MNSRKFHHQLNRACFSLGVCRIGQVSKVTIENESQFLFAFSFYSTSKSEIGNLFAQRVSCSFFRYPAVVANIRLKL